MTYQEPRHCGIPASQFGDRTICDLPIRGLILRRRVYALSTRLIRTIARQLTPTGWALVLAAIAVGAILGLVL